MDTRSPLKAGNRPRHTTGALHPFAITATLLMLMAAAAFVRMYGLGVWDYYHDEIWHVYVAQQLSLADLFYVNLTQDGHPILSYLLQGYALRLWDDPWMARMPSLVAGLLCIPAGYFLGKELFESKSGGLFAAFFMAFSQLMIEQSQVARGYAPMMLFSILALWSVYRYRRHYALGYVLAYFIFGGLALLSEFAAAPVIGFCGLRLGYDIFKKPGRRLVALFLWAIIHLAFLVYLLAFTRLLHDIGGADLSQSLIFFRKHESTFLENAAKFILYLINFIHQVSFSPFLFVVFGSDILPAVLFLLFLSAVVAGFFWLVRYRQWWLLVLVLTPIATAVGFYYLDIVGLDFARRNMAVVFSFMILFYCGFRYFIHHALPGGSLRFSPIPMTLASAAILTLGFAVHGLEWRESLSYEFQQTREQTAEAFRLLDTHMKSDDIIITDWSTYFQIRKHAATCEAKLVSADLAYDSCYRVPLFIVRGDIRMTLPLFNMAQAQRAFAQLDQLHRLNGARYVWLVAMQHIDIKMPILDFTYPGRTESTLQFGRRYFRAEDLTVVLEEQKSFSHWASRRAAYKKTAYTPPCAAQTEEAQAIKENCSLSLVLVALPVQGIYEKMVNHPPYHDPNVIVEQIKQGVRKNRGKTL